MTAFAVPARAAVGAVEYAGWPRRAAALAIDAVFVWTCAGVLAGILGAAAPQLPLPPAVPLAFLLFPTYFTLAHGGRSGRTAGKAALGIAVRDARTYGPLGYGRAFARWLVAFLFWLVLVVGTTAGLAVALVVDLGDRPSGAAGLALVLLSAVPALADSLSPLWHDRRRAWHDRAAGSIVVRV
ncbi:MAG: RDD family protein [Thermoleophilia bacterium]|nr:RDD family protein [Thermoleophilia bacterium]